MIAELFYPKELKEIIADLRAKDDLNEEALDVLNSNSVIFFMMFFLFFIFRPSFDHISGHFLYLILMIILWAASVCFAIRSNFFNKMASYALGHKRKGIILEKIRRWNGYSRNTDLIRLEIADIESQESLTTGAISFKLNNYIPNKDEGITFYHNTKNKKYKPMPDIKEIKALYCLSKSKIEE